MGRWDNCTHVRICGANLRPKEKFQKTTPFNQTRFAFCLDTNFQITEPFAEFTLVLLMLNAKKKYFQREGKNGICTIQNSYL
jgi:hypothetical protein